MQAEIESIRAQLEELSARLEALEANPEPEPEEMTEREKTDAIAAWDRAVAGCTERCRGNLAKAAIMANRENPGLRQRMLRAHNRR